MKNIICVIIILLSHFYINAQIVGFDYDSDGNMKLRKVFTVGSSTVKGNSEQSTELDEKIGELKITVLPNPTSGIFQVSILNSDLKQDNYYCIYSLNGSLLMKNKINSVLTDIDISPFSTGTYLMDVYLSNKISRWKIVKK